MHRLWLFIVAATMIIILALGVFALVENRTTSGGDVIIIKGGSLTIQCPDNIDCLEAKGDGKYDHKDNKDTTKDKKITEIVVKDDDGKVLGTFTRSEKFPNGKPSIEITYK